MTVTFNIVYTPGTVKYLSFFVWSLLHWSDCAFRLVSNGCFPPEQNFLEKLCQQHPRLSYCNLPGGTSLRHSRVLNLLQQMHQTDYFAFMDSDILATGPFMETAQSNLANNAATFAAPPLWVTAHDEILPQGFQIMSGLHTTAENGLCLGSSPFSIYRTSALQGVMNQLKTGFEERHWSQLTPEIRQQFHSLNMEKTIYDTGKALNLLLQARGETVIYRHIPSLIHLGGFSFLAFSQPTSTPAFKHKLKQMIKSWLPASLCRTIRDYRAYRPYRKYSTDEYKAIVRQRQKQRNPTRQYFFRLLAALAESNPLPTRPVIGVPEIDQQLKKASQAVIDLHQTVQTGRIYDHIAP